jgi:hypothetical protein
MSARKCVEFSTLILEAFMLDVDLVEKAVSFLFPGDFFPVFQ